MRRLLLAVLLFLAPAAAWAAQDTCTFSASGNWSAIGSHPTAACTGGDNNSTIDSADLVVIPTGITITITGNVTQSSTASITVQSGGSLRLPITSSSGRLVLTVGTGGLDCQAGSTCEFTGRYRSLGTSPDWVSTPSTTTYWQFGDFNRLTADIAESRWPSTPYNRATGTSIATGIQTSIASWLNNGTINDGVAAGDVVCFWNPSGIATAASPDSYACYPITGATSTASPYRIGFRTAVSSSPKPVPQAMQEMPTGTTGAAITLATRTAILGTGLISAGQEHYFVGRWLRLEDPRETAAYEPYGYRILSVTDDAGGDIVKLADTRGFGAYYPSGVDYVVDYGWRRGDPMLIYRPAEVTCVTVGRCPLTLTGTVNVRAAKFNQFEDVLFATGTAITDFTDVFLNQFNNQAGGTHQAGYTIKMRGNAAATISRVFSAGGDFVGEDQDAVGGETQHGIAMLSFNPSDAPSMIGTDVTFRYVGDDCLLSQNNGSSIITMTRLRCQWLADEGASANLVDTTAAGTATRVSITDGECLDCTNDGFSSSSLWANGSTSYITLNGLLVYGYRGANNATNTEQNITNTNYMQIGANGSFSTTSGQMFPTVLSKFVLRENIGSGTNVVYYNDSVALDPALWSDGLVIGNTQTGTPPSYAMQWASTSSKQPTLMSNVAFVDNLSTASSTSTGFFQMTDLETGSIFRNISLINRPGLTTNTYERPWVMTYTGTEPYTISYNLITGFKAFDSIAMVISASSPPAAYAKSPWTGPHATHEGWCLFDNLNDVSGITYAEYASSTAFSADRPLNFLDPAQRLFGGASGSLPASYGCGANTRAGITIYKWMHAISGMVPESMGTIGGGGGGSGMPRGY